MQVGGNRLPGPGGDFFQREGSLTISHGIFLPTHGAGDQITFCKIGMSGFHHNTLPRPPHHGPNLHTIPRDPSGSNRHPKWRRHDQISRLDKNLTLTWLRDLRIDKLEIINTNLIFRVGLHQPSSIFHI